MIDIPNSTLSNCINKTTNLILIKHHRIAEIRKENVNEPNNFICPKWSYVAFVNIQLLIQ